MSSQFDDLVRSLEADTLEELRRAVAVEVGGRRQQAAIRMEDIHPKMSAAQKDQAAQEIARVLRGDEPHA
jgi:hypothetical protein